MGANFAAAAAAKFVTKADFRSNALLDGAAKGLERRPASDSVSERQVLRESPPSALDHPERVAPLEALFPAVRGSARS